MNPYLSQYYSKQWQTKRKVILKRDGYKCRRCGAKKNLQVHHKYYRKNRKVWNYPNKALITYCKVCHENTHKKHDNFIYLYALFFLILILFFYLC